HRYPGHEVSVLMDVLVDNPSTGDLATYRSPTRRRQITTPLLKQGLARQVYHGERQHQPDQRADDARRGAVPAERPVTERTADGTHDHTRQPEGGGLQQHRGGRAAEADDRADSCTGSDANAFGLPLADRCASSPPAARRFRV